MNTVRWVRWLGVAASGLVLGVLALKASHFFGRSPSGGDILLYLVVAVLPSYVNVFLTALGHFWWSFGIGLWITFLAALILFDKHASPESMILLLAAVTICITPFLNRAYAGKKSNKDGGAESKDPSIEKEIEAKNSQWE